PARFQHRDVEAPLPEPVGGRETREPRADDADIRTLRTAGGRGLGSAEAGRDGTGDGAADNLSAREFGHHASDLPDGQSPRRIVPSEAIAPASNLDAWCGEVRRRGAEHPGSFEQQ